MQKSIIFSTAVLFAVTSAADSDRCMALALEGGGAKGAYEAGVIWGLMHYGNPDDFQWQVVSGISAGAVNTGALSVWRPDQGLEMSQWVSDKWSNLSTPDIWTFWDDSRPLKSTVDAIFNESGVFNDQALLDYMTATMGEIGSYGEGRRSVVAATSVNTGEEIVMNSDLPFDLWPRAVTSSASIPGVFPTQHFMDDVLMDGGVASWGVNPVIAIRECLKIVDDVSKITMDIVMEEAVVIDELDDDNFSTLGHYMRGRQISKYNKGMANVFQAMRAYPEVNWRYLVQPSGDLPNGPKLILFGNHSTWYMQEMGREDGKNLILQPEGYGFIKLSEWKEAEEKKGVFTRFADYLWDFTN